MRTLIALLLASGCVDAQWRVMPMPASIRAGEGRMQIGPGFGIQPSRGSWSRHSSAIGRMQDRIGRLIGLSLGADGTGLSVQVKMADSMVQSLEDDESYRLEVTRVGAVLTSPTVLGEIQGLETFFQLIEKTADGWSVPAVTIEDRPRFAWRGLMLDVSRHFMPLDVVKRTLDGMAAVKLNVFHWHLSDDQGFRVESMKFPKLQELGSDGNFYTQDDIRAVIEYARFRGIRVVPEFDMPGHTASWLVGYPELGSVPGPYRIVRTWGISDPTMDPAKPEVYAFLDTFIGEMASLFPDTYFHIGGDEVNGRHWNGNTTDIPAFMKERRFAGQQDLHAYFNQQVQKILTKYGKHMEGWDEILNPALPKDIVIQSWRGAKSLADAARQGYAGILSSGYYLDHTETSAKMYLVDPMGGLVDSLGAADKQRILGGEICMWTEYTSAENVESRMWPRSAAIAERLWSPAGLRDVPDMYRRLTMVDSELDQLGLRHNLNYRTMLERLAGSADIEAVQTLTDVLAPGALRLRHHVNPNYTQSTPLNRLADVARPDSSVARHFSEVVDRYLSNKTDTAARDEIRRWLNLWSGNDAKVQALASRRAVLRDAAPVSATLAKISAQALASMASGTPHKASADLQAARKPIGEVTIAVTAPIGRLIEAAW